MCYKSKRLIFIHITNTINELKMKILIKKYGKIGLCLLFGLSIFSACNKDFGEGDLITYDNTVKSKIDSLPQFSFFKELYKYCDSLTTSTKADVVPVGTTYPSVGGALGSNFITGFIPTNEAFKANGIATILVNGKLNPVFAKFLTRDTAAANLTSANVIRNFLMYNLNNKVLDPSVFSDNINIKALTAGAVDTVYIRKIGADYFVNGFSKIDVGSVLNGKNGRLYATNSLVTPVYNGQFLQLVKLDTSLSLFNLALTRANDATITATANTATIFNTTFAPTNQAFIDAGLNTAAINAATPAALAAILKHHFIRQRLFTNDLVDGSLTMLSGTAITITTGSAITIKSANTTGTVNIVGNNINYARGIMYKIDKVLKF
jgi:uncharacterized surface protein with fasciclin (FAS1) repeats